MRKLITVAAAAYFLTASIAAAPMTAGDRQRLVAHLDMTESWLVSELSGLSPAQLTYKTSPDAWSVAEVTEHLAIAEPQVLAAGAGLDEAAGDNREDGGHGRGDPVVRHRSDQPSEDWRGARAARHVQDSGRRARSLSQAARDDA